MAAPSPQPEAPKPGGGPPSPEEIERTLHWVGARFAEYYRANPPPMPARYGRREFGFIPAPVPPPGRTPFFRHMALRGREDLHRYLVQRAPWHAYYSVAYYKTPDAPTMKEKEWLGADLIFDLDADHLTEEAKTWSYEKQLVEVKKAAQHVLEEFVLKHFGFDPDHVHVVFSGGRGYHIHVTDPRVFELGSPERREIVDYVTGLGFKLDLCFSEKSAAGKTRTGNDKTEYVKVLAPPDAPGWPGLVSRRVHTFFEEVIALPDGEALKRLRALPEVGETRAKRMLTRLRSNQVDAIGRAVAEAPEEALKAIADTAKAAVEGEADEPVTTDVRRLIRLPYSLHGKTGFRVTPIPIDRFRDFDPMQEAVAFDSRLVKVKVSKPEPIPFANDLEIKPGIQDLPLNAAMFLILRRRALVA
ncbi:MAG TPA: DNA primase catalytic subunit PriS [Candidatus Thermoplasmatota archaeon]|nr:DNA primase catalytic subunit PriS [Candidatus Thermoplasmatota archaeon]